MQGGGSTIGAFLIALTATLASATSIGDPRKIYVPWPEGWELMQMPHVGRTAHLRGRDIKHGFVLQELAATIVDLRDAGREPTSAELEQLARRLRNRFEPDRASGLQAFTARRGYYYGVRAAPNSPAAYKSTIEGVVFEAGYLINFTLHTNAADISRTEQLLRALGELEVR